jgi:ribosomal protein S18 acetylase RimI-like enzyme
MVIMTEQKNNFKLRSIEQEDLRAALVIIKKFDSDDYKWAKKAFRKDTLNIYVLADEDEIIGVTGFKLAEQTVDTCWLSWTYLSEQYRGKGLGLQMLTELFEIIRAQNFRKIFVSTSDYVDPAGNDIYGPARKCYLAMGFAEEIIHKDYYQPGESQYIYGYSFQENIVSDKPLDNRPVNLNGIFKISETRDLYAIDWEFSTSSYSTGKDMPDILAEAGKKGARSLMVSFPSDVPGTDSGLQQIGFSSCGSIKDYFEDNVHDNHYRYNFSQK